jgi:hypothetical protein
MGIWLRWWSFQDGCVVIGGDDERRMVEVHTGVGSWFGLVVGDGWGLSVVSAAQGTDPDESRIITHIRVVSSPASETRPHEHRYHRHEHVRALAAAIS